MKKTYLAIGASLLFGPSLSFSATVVSVDFYLNGGGWDFHERATNSANWNLDQVGAGVESVAGGNWNTFQTTATGATGTNLLDNMGASSGIGFSIVSDFHWYSKSNGSQIDKALFDGTGSLTGDSLNQARSNLRILTTQLGANTGGSVTLSLSDISYAAYDIIVYVGGDDANGRKGAMALGSSTFYYLTQAGSAFQAAPDFIQATATDEADAATANYIRFSGLSGDSQTLTLDALTGNLGITGFQVVEVIPEPSTYALAGGVFALGVTLVIRRRRKN
ncbi:MAG: PEP-CTERM sorting domain-containing protein [Puniceicoccales bacterium]|jgi:hypothetical protein|nr:PEP-CTERM sorting domain-containing protein [Puniceicoccales bacterium]